MVSGGKVGACIHGFITVVCALADEELVARAKKADGQEALDLFTRRYREWLEHCVAELCKARHWRPEDRQDAQQHVFFWFCEAVRTFDPARIRAGHERPFQAFLFRVIRQRFADFARSVERERKDFGQSLDSLQLLDSQVFQIPGPVGSGEPSSRGGRDPAVIAQENEKYEQLAAAVQKLTERQRQVWELLWSGATLQTVAETFGVSYAGAWYWQQQIVAILPEAVRDKSERE